MAALFLLRGTRLFAIIWEEILLFLEDLKYESFGRYHPRRADQE